MSTRVLVVDDSLTVRMDLGDALESAGLPTTRAASGAQMREAIQKESFGLIILDLLLPDADGIDLLAELRRDPRFASIPVMLLSSEVEVKDRVRGLTTGADQFIGKPYDTAYVIERATQLTAKAVAATGPAAAATVLIIEDSLTFREELKVALATAGYAVLAAASGEEGLSLAAIRRPNAAVIDGNLPGIDGATVVRRLRADVGLRGMPCVMLTGSSAEADELTGLDAGADAYVRKADDHAVLLARLASLLRGASASMPKDHESAPIAPRKILAVDDSPTYLHQLGDELRDDGYDVAFARSGEEAVELLNVEPFDGILMDVMMPGLGGLEAARQIKAIPAMRDIPLVMLTGKSDREAMLEGLNAGADDYVTKSADFDVLKGRLRAQLRRKHFQDENRRVREELNTKEIEAAQARAAHELLDARTRMEAQITQSARLSAIGAMASGVAHEVNSPLGFILANLSFVTTEVAALAQETSGSSERLELLADVQAALAEAIGGVERVRNVVSELQNFSHVDQEQRAPLDLRRILELGLSAVAPEWSELGTIKTEFGEALPVNANAARLSQVLIQVISTAGQTLPKRQSDKNVVWVKTFSSGEMSVVEISTNGPPLAPRLVTQLFDAARPVGSLGSGLSMSISNGLVSAMGGKIAFDSKPGRGVIFRIELPAVIEASPTAAVQRLDLAQ